MPRRATPLNPDDGPQARFALALRRLRDRAGFDAKTIEAIGAENHIPKSTLYAAMRGERIPTIPVLAALVRAWNGDPEEWLVRRTETEQEVERLRLQGKSRPPLKFQRWSDMEPSPEVVAELKARLVAAMQESEGPTHAGADLNTSELQTGVERDNSAVETVRLTDGVAPNVVLSGEITLQDGQIRLTEDGELLGRLTDANEKARTDLLRAWLDEEPGEDDDRPLGLLKGRYQPTDRRAEPPVPTPDPPAPTFRSRAQEQWARLRAAAGQPSVRTISSRTGLAFWAISEILRGLREGTADAEKVARVLQDDAQQVERSRNEQPPVDE